MQILIITNFFPPLNSIASLRPYYWAKYWASEGHDVTVLTTEKKGHFSKNTLSLPIEGFKILEVPEPVLLSKLRKQYTFSSPSSEVKPSKPSTLLAKAKKKFEKFRERSGILSGCRMPDLLDLWKSKALKNLMEETGRKKVWDLVVSTYSPYVCHQIGYELKKRGRAKKWIADYRDLWVDSHMKVGIFPFKFYERYLERKYLKQADIVTTVSKELASTLKAQYPFARLEVIANGFDTHEWDHLEKDAFFPSDGKLRIVFAGTIYKGLRDPSPLFEAIGNLRKDTFIKELIQAKIELIFAGDKTEDLLEIAERYQVQDLVKLYGLLPKESALRMQRDASVLLHMESGQKDAKGVLTGKIFEYIYARKPILAIGVTKDSASGVLIEETQSGVVLEKDVQKIQDYLLRILQGGNSAFNPQLASFLQRFDRKNLASEMLALI